MTINEALAIMEQGEFNVYGIRVDREGLAEGFELDNSHDWFQDWDSSWGEPDDIYDDPDHPYSDDLGCWDGGELSGACALEVCDDDIDDVIRTARRRYITSGVAVYLIGGTGYEYGNDSGEIIIENAVVIGTID